MTLSSLQTALLVLALTVVASPVASVASNDYGVLDEVTVTQGETVAIPVSLPADETATLVVGDRTVGYRLVATVSDGNGDGEVVVAFDTQTAGADGDPVVATAEADDVSVQSESQFRHPYRSVPVLDAGEYRLSVKLNESADERDAGTLVVTAVDSCPDEHASASDAYGISDVNAFAGETAEIPVSLPRSDEVTLRMTGPDGEFRLTATVTDGNGDGSVLVRFDTARGGTTDHPVSVAAGDDSISVATKAGDLPSLDTLDAKRSGLALWSGKNTSVACNGEERAILTLDELGTYGLPSAVETMTGDVVELPVTVPENRSARLRIEGTDPTYRLALQVTDGDGDGKVLVTFDTSTVGTGEPPVTAASEADGLSVESSSTRIVDQPLAPGEYALSLAVDADRPPGEVADGTLVVDADDTSTESTTSTDGQAGFTIALTLVALGFAAVATTSRF